jgi:general L-amino acid transport system substrate-binding protein
MKTGLSIAVAGIACGLLAASASAATLDDVKSKGFVQCGVNTGLLGFGAPNDAGEWSGFDVDYCRAIAAAIFNDPAAVKFTPLTATERFTALQSGEVDVLVRNTTWTMSRDTSQGLTFAGVNYYDGQGFMVRKSLSITSALELGGATVCVQTGTTTELNLADFFAANDMAYTPVAFEKLDEVNAAYAAQRCDAYTTDASGLYAIRLTQTNPDDHAVLPEIISKEPLGPTVRKGDWRFFDIVRWSLFAQIAAEELGVTSANVEEMARTSTNPDVQRLLGRTGDLGRSMGLENDWAVRIIRQVGNYGEMYERNITPIGITRGVNNLWTNGGLHYAPPIR